MQIIKTMKKLFSIMSKQNQYDFKLDFQQLDQHTGGKWLIYGWLHKPQGQSVVKPGSPL